MLEIKEAVIKIPYYGVKIEDFSFHNKAYDPEENYGDNKEDHAFVKKGIQMYYEDYPDAEPGINRTFP